MQPEYVSDNERLNVDKKTNTKDNDRIIKQTSLTQNLESSQNKNTIKDQFYSVSTKRSLGNYIDINETIQLNKNNKKYLSSIIRMPWKIESIQNSKKSELGKGGFGRVLKAFDA